MGLGNPKMGLSPGASQNECISWGIPKRVHVLRNPQKGPSLGEPQKGSISWGCSCVGAGTSDGRDALSFPKSHWTHGAGSVSMTRGDWTKARVQITWDKPLGGMDGLKSY